MLLAVGKKVIYPGHGPCLVSSIVDKTVDEKAITFYQLLVLGDHGEKLFVPVDKIKTVGIRPLLKQADVPKLFDQLKRPSTASTDRKQRACDNAKLLSSGSAFDLAEIVESLTELGETKALSSRERATLDRAKRLLVYEISEVMGATKQEAEQQVDQTLIARTGTKACAA